MERRRGTALLIGGHVVGGGRGRASAVTAALTAIGETLHAAVPAWRVVSLTSARAAVIRDGVDRAMRGALRDRPDIALIIAAGSLGVTPDGELGLLADLADSSSAPSAAAWIPLSRLRAPAQPGTRAVTVVVGWPVEPAVGDPAASWLAALVARPGDPVVDDLVVTAAGDRVVATLEALHDGLRGAALDVETGTITLRSLGAYLSRAAPGLAIHASALGDTVVTPPALTGPLDPRLTWRSRVASPEPAPLAAIDLCGATLPGRFRVDAELARGGFGTVYRARQLTVDRDVAIKVLHADIDPASASGRLFVQEIQGVGKIDHPNVVRIHHADVTSAGQLFFAMELLAGRDLEHVIKAEGRLPAPRVIEWMRQLLAGLAAAHDADLVHADIKPANALLVPTRDGERAVLIDFGLSRLRAAGGASLSVGGTPAYMAPEQLEHGRVDARSDLFSIALVMVTLLTGWRRTSMAELVPPLADIADPALRRTLARALAIDPAQRFASAAELSAALAAPAPRPRPRRRALVAGALAAGGLALGAAWLRPDAAVTSAQTAVPVVAAASEDSLPVVTIGGSGTLLWGFFAPLDAFLEDEADASIPLTSKNDLGSGGALAALRKGDLDFAAMSRRYEPPASGEVFSPGKLLIEVAVGFDETALFVWRDNPLRTIDLADVRAHLCCRPETQEVPAMTWRDLGATPAPLGDASVQWFVFGRTPHPSGKQTTSATLALADAWLCAPDRLCPSSMKLNMQANDVLPALVKDPHSLALSSRSFATDQVAALTLTDRAHHRRLDGRKVLWLYALGEVDRPLPGKICRALAAVLHPAVAGRLAAAGRATGLPDALRVQQREALGLDDHACEHQTVTALTARPASELAAGVMTSPVADAVEVTERWIPDP